MVEHGLCVSVAEYFADVGRLHFVGDHCVQEPVQRVLAVAFPCLIPIRHRHCGFAPLGQIPAQKILLVSSAILNSIRQRTASR